MLVGLVGMREKQLNTRGTHTETGRREIFVFHLIYTLLIFMTSLWLETYRDPLAGKRTRSIRKTAEK